jgi:Ran GTPase-activating protein (RanGAP) involved in mRNA processing and transport
MDIAKSIATMGASVKLNMSDNKIGGKKDKSGMNALTEMLKTNIVLQELDLSSNSLSKKDVTILADGLSANRALTSLDISNNKMACSAAGNALSDMLSRNSTLKHLNVSNCGGLYSDGGIGFAKELAVGVSTNGALTSLNISANKLVQGKTDMTGIKALAAAIPQCK